MECSQKRKVKNKTEGVYMTTSFKKSRHKKILALCLSSFMLAAAAASFVACGDGKDSSVDDSEVSTTENDTSRITNGSFEFFEDDNGRNLIITSPTGWSKSTGSSASVPLPPLRRPAALSIPPRKRGKISLLLRDSLTTRKAKQRQIGITSPQRTSWISTISGRKRTTTTTSRTSISTIRTRIISISTSTTSPIAKIL